jgi:hypothetical protein
MRNSARMFFGAALALYFLWVAALAAMAVVSSTRPGANRSQFIRAPASSPGGRVSPAK